MSLLDDASLVVIPSGYKAGTVYSVKPTNGDGDLTFSRASDATRVNSLGLVEKVRTNVLLQSNAFSTSPWVNGGSTTITSGQTDPNGGSNAFKIEFGATNSYLGQFNGGLTGSVTISAYFRADSSTTIGFNDGSTFPNSITIGTTWQRYSFTYVVSGSQCNIEIDNYFGVSPISQAKTFYIYGAQLEASDFGPTDYIPTTSAAVSVGMTANVPRLDYTGGGCPKLILEPQRTNLALYSEQLDNAAWIKNNSTVTANQGISPDGYTNADLFYINSAGDVSSRRIIQVISVSNATTYTASVFVKSSSARWIWFPAPDASSVNHNAWFDLENGVVGTVGSSVIDTSIVSYGNGWYRCSVTSLSTSTTNYVLFSPVTADGSTTTLTGSSNGFLTYGGQLEAGSYPTSYIPTLGASVTRLADAAVKTSASALINSEEGVAFVDITINGLFDFGTPLSLTDGTLNNYIWFTIFGNGDLRVEFYKLGVVQASLTYNGATVGNRYKMAFAYATNDFALYVNGTQIGTDNSGTTFSANTLTRIDTYLTNAATFSASAYKHNQLLLFPTRLSNTELASLTTL